MAERQAWGPCRGIGGSGGDKFVLLKEKFKVALFRDDCII